MESEKSDVPSAVVTFASRGEAERRIAGVAAAARIVNALAESGHDRIWLAIPGGDPLRDDAGDDVRRLAGGANVLVVDGNAVPVVAGRGADELRVIPAPRLRTAEFLRMTAKTEDGPVSRWVNRRISRPISGLLLRFPAIRPIHATAGTAILGMAMFAALAAGGVTGMIAGGLLFQAASIFDGVDGEIARATFRTSPGGAALDSLIDAATNLLFILGVILNLGEREGERAVVAGAWGLLLFAIGLGLLSWRAAHSEGPFSLDLLKHGYRRRFPRGFAAGIVVFATAVTSRDFFALLFALLILGGQPMGVLHIFAGAATAWFLFLLAAVPSRNPRPKAERSA